MNIAIKSMALILAILLTREIVTNDGRGGCERGVDGGSLSWSKKKWEF